MNLDDASGEGTHWVAWYKRGGLRQYFDSYGLRPPKEVVCYLGVPVYYNSDRVQGFDEVICGHLCVLWLRGLDGGESFESMLKKFVCYKRWHR